MGDAQTPEHSRLSIDALSSTRQLRALNPHTPLDELHISSGRVFNVKLAREISGWQSVRKIVLWSKTTRAALRELLATPGLQDIYVSSLHDHGSLNGMPRPANLHRFACGWPARTDLLHIADLPNLVALSAEYAKLSSGALNRILAIESLTDLDLEGSTLDDDMAKDLATSQNIVRLDIGATRVGPAGLRHICQMTQLKELDIWALDIRESDLDMLAALTNLEYLSVGGCDEQEVLTAKGVLPRIAKLPSLKRLWLDGIALTDGEIADLKQRYEEVQVTFF
ncbi:MAG: hypothetical protein HUJ27_07210 [Rhodobacteraceae bacterium]|nr:hypothetical protein [Paracoccaceae bacterium]